MEMRVVVVGAVALPYYHMNGEYNDPTPPVHPYISTLGITFIHKPLHNIFSINTYVTLLNRYDTLTHHFLPFSALLFAFATTFDSSQGA